MLDLLLTQYYMLQIPQKWVIYIVTFFTYTAIHSIRTQWSTLKPTLSQYPYNFSQEYLGTLDMIVLFTLAVCLNLFGNYVQKYPIRKLLKFVQLSVLLDLVILFIFLKLEYTSEALYIIFYGLMGVFGCLGWPICLYTLSQYFDSKKCLPLSLWNSVSQFGDFLAFIISWLITKVIKIEAYYSLLVLGGFIFIMFIVDLRYFREAPKMRQTQKKQHQNQSKDDAPPQNLQDNMENKQANQQQANPQQNKLNLQNKGEQIDIKLSNVIIKPEQPEQPHIPQIKSQIPSNPVNFINVWALPGVACTVLAYSIIKAINSAVVVWLVFFLIKYQKFTQATAIAIAWPIGIIIGSLIGAKTNPEMSYVKFILFTIVSGIVFLFLGEMHSKPHQINVLILLIVCAIALGAPYNQMSTAVPLKLSEQEQIQSRPGAKSSIMSLMQGFGQLMCGITVLIIPSIGVQSINLICFTMCVIGISLLGFQILRKRIKEGLPLLNIFSKSPKKNEPQIQFQQIVQEK